MTKRFVDSVSLAGDLSVYRGSPYEHQETSGTYLSSEIHGKTVVVVSSQRRAGASVVVPAAPGWFKPTDK